MGEQKGVSLRLLILLVVAAAIALYVTAVHVAAVESSLTRADQAELDLREATHISETLVRLRGSLSTRADKTERMLISFIEEMATQNRISLASITIDPGTLKEGVRINKFYKEIDTTVRIKQVPLKNIVLFIADIQTRDPSLEAKVLSLMPGETDPQNWDARVVISYFVFDEETEEVDQKQEKSVER